MLIAGVHRNRVSRSGSGSVAVWPDSDLGVVGEVGVGEGVPAVGAGGIGGLGDGDAFQERRCRHGELGDQPTVSDLVIADAPVNVVVGLTTAAEARPQRVGRDRPKKLSPDLSNTAKSELTIWT